MHFPPGDDGDDIVAPVGDASDEASVTDDDAHKGTPAAQNTFTNWTEPALRSDRMCWSLMGAAHTLA